MLGIPNNLPAQLGVMVKLLGSMAEDINKLANAAPETRAVDPEPIWRDLPYKPGSAIAVVKLVISVDTTGTYYLKVGNSQFMPLLLTLNTPVVIDLGGFSSLKVARDMEISIVDPTDATSYASIVAVPVNQ